MVWYRIKETKKQVVVRYLINRVYEVAKWPSDRVAGWPGCHVAVTRLMASNIYRVQ